MARIEPIADAAPADCLARNSLRQGDAAEHPDDAADENQVDQREALRFADRHMIRLSQLWIAELVPIETMSEAVFNQ